MVKRYMILKGLKKPYRIPSYLYSKIRNLRDQSRGRISFSHTQVVSWPRPEFCALLYEQVNLLQTALANCSATRSLEIGCGYGRLTPWIRDYSKDHYAIEPEPKLLDDARKLYPAVKFYEATVQNLPFHNNYFDLIVSWIILQHIPPKEFPKAVEEIKRVAHPTATILIAELTEGEKGNRWWPRSVHEYEEIFKPWKLVCNTKRRIMGLSKNSEELMVFKTE
jgi:SAM-dependent methyltransferase